MRLRGVLAVALLVVGGCAAMEESRVAPKPGSETARATPQPSNPVPPVAIVAPAPRPVQPEPEPVPPSRVPPPTIKPSEVEILLTEFERVRRLPAVEIVREQDAARQAFSQSRSDAARVRLAMMLAIPGIPGGEDVRALELLDPIVRNPTASLHGFAFLLAAYIQEQRRLATQVQGLQHNVQALQQKLDALRTLERSLTERESPRRR